MLRRSCITAMLAVALTLAAVPLLTACDGSRSSADASANKAGVDWTSFGYDAARHNSGPAATGITAANVGGLAHERVQLDGTVDSSPIYLRAVRVGTARHDVFIVTTSYGRTLAVDADSGAVLWRFTPADYEDRKSTRLNSSHITNSYAVFC